MPLNNPRPGLSYAPEYQVSALPWVTSSVAPAAGSPVEYDFKDVTRFVSVINTGTGSQTLSFGFTRNGVVLNNNKVIVPAGVVYLAEWRVKSIFIQGETGTPPYSLAVGLTTIDAGLYPILTGSAVSGSVDPSWDGVG